MREPNEIVAERLQLARNYQDNQNLLASIRMRKATDMIRLVDEHKSVAKAKLYYEATQDGQDEIRIEHVCRGQLEIMRSIKSEMDAVQSEYWK